MLAVALGGGGVAYGLHNLAIQLAALGVLATNGARVAKFVRQLPRLLMVLVLLTLAFPLLQLLPLPPWLWLGLPGREVAAESRALASIHPTIWAPTSLDPARTLVAFLGMIAPATIIAIGSTLGREDRVRLVVTVALAALAAMLLGTVQLASANSAGMLYPIRSAPDVLYASFANRNSAGLLFVLALLLLVALPLEPMLTQARHWLLARGIAGVLLIIGTVLTQSRSAMVLLALAGVFVLMRLGFAALQKRRRPAPIAKTAIIASLALAGVLAASTLTGGRVADSLERFDTLETDRLEMWDDAYFAAGEYWPIGSGMGTFDEVFQLHESLEYVSPRKAGRAHSDWLEIAIEGGAFALLLAAAWLVLVLLAACRRPTKGEGWLHYGAGLGLVCIALQALLDYPLRNQSLLCVAAVLVVLLTRHRESAR